MAKAHKARKELKSLQAKFIKRLAKANKALQKAERNAKEDLNRSIVDAGHYHRVEIPTESMFNSTRWVASISIVTDVNGPWLYVRTPGGRTAFSEDFSGASAEALRAVNKWLKFHSDWEEWYAYI